MQITDFPQFVRALRTNTVAPTNAGRLLPGGRDLTHDGQPVIRRFSETIDVGIDVLAARFRITDIEYAAEFLRGVPDALLQLGDVRGLRKVEVRVPHRA